MKNIFKTALLLSTFSILSCSKSDEASTSTDAIIRYEFHTTNAQTTSFSYIDKDGKTQSYSGSIKDFSLTQSVHKPFNAAIAGKAYQANINNNVVASVYIINHSTNDTLAKSTQSMARDSAMVAITKTVN